MIRSKKQILINRGLTGFGILLIALILGGCSHQSTMSKTLFLSLSRDGNNYKVTNYQVKNHPFEIGSGQEGIYRVHLLDKNHNILQKIGFGELYMHSAGTGNNEVELALPMNSKLYQIAIYKLDGSSGHYRLNSDKPLLTWTLPDSVRIKS